MTSKLALTQKLRELYARGENLAAYLRSLDHASRNTVEDIMLSYDFQAGSYIAAYEQNPRYLEDYTDALATVIRGLGSCESILEVGVGEATTFTLLAGKMPAGLAWWGFDISWSRIRLGQEFAARRGPPGWKPELFCADLFEPPLGDRCFDVVYSSHSLEPNGGYEREALAAVLRLARKWLVLLEPAYDLAPPEARERMERHGYIRNLADVIRSMGLDLVEHRLFPVTANPLNPTGLYLVRLDTSTAPSSAPVFVCPITRTPLERGPEAFYSPQAMLAYPILDGVACLTPANAILATKYRREKTGGRGQGL